VKGGKKVMSGIALSSLSIFGQATGKPKSCRNLEYKAGIIRCSFFRAMTIPDSLSDFVHIFRGYGVETWPRAN
jgi:hypothetical protein